MNSLRLLARAGASRGLPVRRAERGLAVRRGPAERRPTNRWRRFGAVLAAFAVLGLAGIALPQSASAIPGLSDCKEAPTPEVPGRGVEAFFQPAPATATAAGDPFAADTKTSIFEQYGYAGLRWNTYDLGCTAGAGSPEASVGTTVANWLFTVPKAAVAATGALLGAAYEPSFLRVFDPLVQTVVDALRRSVFDQWAGLVFAGLGFVIVWRARRSSLRTTAAALGWALFVMMLATVLFRWPVAAGQAADSTVTSTMSSVTAALNQNDLNGRSTTGDLAVSNLHDALLYQVWLGGQFGDANSATALRYGPALFDAQALTWAEAATLNADPAAGRQITEAKKAKFQQTAAQVQAADPDAYEYLTGRRSDARIGFATLALLAVACAVPFLLIAALLVIGALIITRVAVMMFPIIATLGLFPAMRGIVIGIGNTVAAAIINALVFGVGTAVMVKAYGVVMAPGNGLPSWLIVALVLLLTIVMWYALQPFQRLTGMVAPGRYHSLDTAGALGSVTRGLGRVSGRVATTAAGVFTSESARDKAEDEKKDGPRALRRAEADSRADTDGSGTVGTGPAGKDRGGVGASRGTGTGVSGGGGRVESKSGERHLLNLFPRGRRAAGPDDGGAKGGGRQDSDQLLAAEAGLPWSRGRRPSDLAEARSARAERPQAGARQAEAQPARSRPPSRWAGDPAPGGPSRRGRAPVRRSEGADLDDLGIHPASARGLPVSDQAADPDGVYRPDDRRGGGARA